MQTIALHTRLKAGHEDEYERIHRVVPAELEAALRAAGVHGWQIWRDGQDLFHLVTVENYRAMRGQLVGHPANVAWQARVGPLHDVPDDYSGEDDGIRLVWALPAEPAEAVSQAGEVGAMAEDEVRLGRAGEVERQAWRATSLPGPAYRQHDEV